jgi:ribosomal protein S12 methylthiotransferase accessory factor
MASSSQAEAFDFLLQQRASCRVAEAAADSPFQAGDSSTQALQKLIHRLHERGHEAFAVDLSTREAVQAGMRVVRVVIPSLMPFSWVQRARFLAHSRLNTAPAKMGYAVHNEAINSFPQPFG